MQTNSRKSTKAAISAFAVSLRSAGRPPVTCLRHGHLYFGPAPPRTFLALRSTAFGDQLVNLEP
jgi:hypothetical protein